jgi:RNA polymerase sigma-70 factor (ECF subfamily)
VLELIQGRRREENFRRVFLRYHRAVFSLFVRRGFSAEDCRDLTQEVFVAVYTGIERLRSEEAFAPWLFSIARHRALRHIEGLQKQPRVTARTAAASEGGREQLTDSVPANDPDALTRMIESEKVAAMREALEELPDRVQDCLRLRLVDGLSNRRIGEVLGISESTVAVHIHRGIKNLRARLRILLGGAPFSGEL